MKFRPEQCPTCTFRGHKNDKRFDEANDKGYHGPFVCFSDGQERLVFKLLIAKRKCPFYQKEGA